MVNSWHGDCNFFLADRSEATWRPKGAASELASGNRAPHMLSSRGIELREITAGPARADLRSGRLACESVPDPGLLPRKEKRADHAPKKKTLAARRLAQETNLGHRPSSISPASSHVRGEGNRSRAVKPEPYPKGKKAVCPVTGRLKARRRIKIRSEAAVHGLSPAPRVPDPDRGGLWTTGGQAPLLCRRPIPKGSKGRMPVMRGARRERASTRSRTAQTVTTRYLIFNIYCLWSTKRGTEGAEIQRHSPSGHHQKGAPKGPDSGAQNGPQERLR